jgi:hypothetical protein
MLESTKTRPVYKLGRTNFAIRNCDPEFEQKLDGLLSGCKVTEASDDDDDDVDEINTGCTKNVRELINHVLRKNSRCVWIGAACLVSPGAKQVLIAGESGSGKTTLCVSLARAHGWKVLSEDVVLIDPETLKILSVGMPFAIKHGTYKMLSEGMGITPELVDGQWYPLGPAAHIDDIDAAIDCAILLDRWAPLFQSSPITHVEFIRKIMPFSNVIRRPVSIEVVTQILQSAQCLAIRGGSIQDRLKLILENVS